MPLADYIAQNIVGGERYTPPITDRTSLFAGFSLRQLSPAYTGPLIRVRNSSTTAEQDFGAAADGFVSASAIATFLGGNAGTISKWYDQGAGGRDVVQSTVANQPTYSPNKYGSRPGLIFNGSSTVLTNASVSWTANDLMLFAVANAVKEPLTSYRVLFQIAGNIQALWTNAQLNDWYAGDARANGNGGGSGVGPRAIPEQPGFIDGYNNQHDLTLSASGVDWFTNGVSNKMGTAVVGAVPSLTGAMDISASAASGFNGTIAEVIVFNTRYSDRTALRANQKAAWIDANPPALPSAIEMWGDSLTAGFQDGTATTVPYVVQQDFLPVNRNVGNRGVSSNTSSQILTRFQAAPWAYRRGTIIWAGRNNLSSSAQVQSDIAAMVAALTTSRYMVLSVINGEGEPSGNATYAQVAALNSALAATYGSNYLDVRAALVAGFNAGNPVDVLDHNGDIPPYTLRATLSGTLTQAGGISAAATSFSIDLSVGAGSILHIGSEYIYVLAGTGTSVTNCTRGYAGTTAAAYPVSQALTANDGLHLGGNGYTVVGNAVYNKILALGGW